MYAYVTVRSPGKFLLCLPPIILQWYAYHYMLGQYGSRRKWLPFTNISKFCCQVLQMITILNETKAAVQPCPPVMINAAKSALRAKTTVVRLCAAVSGYTSKGLAAAQQ